MRSSASWWWFAVGLCSVPIVVAWRRIPLVGVAVASVCSVAGQTVAGLALDARASAARAAAAHAARAGAGLAALAGLGIAVLGSSAGGPGWAVVAAGAALFVGGAVTRTGVASVVPCVDVLGCRVTAAAPGPTARGPSRRGPRSPRRARACPTASV
ncbi:hypothetical protein IU11_07210, partial [Cellulosimicrobium sp. MM]